MRSRQFTTPRGVELSEAHYNYYRDYDPSIGRYIESDPIGLLGGLNTFGYVSQNPLSGYDPRGLTDFLDKCTGRYSSCSVTQRKDSGIVGNWARWKVCEKSVNAACDKAPMHCCEVDRTSCLQGFSPDGSDAITPEQIKKVAECNASYATCAARAGKK